MNNNFDILTSDQLSSMLESDMLNDKLKKTGELLLQAINDWPTSITEPKQLLAVLSKEIDKPLTEENIRSYSKSLKTENEAWKMEAISSVLETFNYGKRKTLDDIVFYISCHYKSA